MLGCTSIYRTYDYSFKLDVYFLKIERKKHKSWEKPISNFNVIDYKWLNLCACLHTKKELLKCDVLTIKQNIGYSILQKLDYRPIPILDYPETRCKKWIFNQKLFISKSRPSSI